eukprot:759574-Hanusia_phi.AAC.7
MHFYTGISIACLILGGPFMNSIFSFACGEISGVDTKSFTTTVCLLSMLPLNMLARVETDLFTGGEGETVTWWLTAVSVVLEASQLWEAEQRRSRTRSNRSWHTHVLIEYTALNGRLVEEGS